MIMEKKQRQGAYHWEHWRGNKKLATGVEHNTVTVEGRNHILNTEFRNTSQAASWFFGLVNNAAFATNPDSDTMVSHAGWTELTAYAEATRPQWSPAAASGGTLTNSSGAVFTFNATNTVHGFFISSNSTKGGTSGVLWSSVPFSTGPMPVESGDEIRVTYTYGISS